MILGFTLCNNFFTNVCLALVIVLPPLGLVYSEGIHDVQNSLRYDVMRGHLHVSHHSDTLHHQLQSSGSPFEFFLYYTQSLILS